MAGGECPRISDRYSVSTPASSPSVAKQCRRPCSVSLGRPARFTAAEKPLDTPGRALPFGAVGRILEEESWGSLPEGGQRMTKKKRPGGGDFARGERTKPTSDEGPDFARGERTKP